MVYLLFYNFTDTVIKVLRSRELRELSQSQTEQILHGCCVFLFFKLGVPQEPIKLCAAIIVLVS